MKNAKSVIYLESSALIAWLLGEPAGPRVLQGLTGVTSVVSSELMLIETDRALHRAVAAGKMSEVHADERRTHLNATAATWNLLEIGPEIVDRSRQRFPFEPLRTLDAIHLASALVARRAAPDLVMLSLDERIRRNAIELGFRVLPRRS